jgi:hypothetical protein
MRPMPMPALTALRLMRGRWWFKQPYCRTCLRAPPPPPPLLLLLLSCLGVPPFVRTRAQTVQQSHASTLCDWLCVQCAAPCALARLVVLVRSCNSKRSVCRYVHMCGKKWERRKNASAALGTEWMEMGVRCGCGDFTRYNVYGQVHTAWSVSTLFCRCR